ncbi:salicylate 1-monooxygenase [Rhodococcus sp. 06-235-1A]|uniref:FAD-dependent monooxygenase n=1 Tax=Rhodococcus sp. 06-235-1A TaxID=2022508 RepID=UPI000B9AC032|nr:FAD-dependent monooxygenase [Rhodococcus sp. 06-235-1A]OZD06587.1 salicylate 1-monooxygenase [Rhodococcus sp. 06-235-1A]
MKLSNNFPRIAIVGGGIGGLAAAAFLHRVGLTATVYEQAKHLGEVGAGLVVSPNSARMLRRLGVFDIFLDSAVPLDIGWEFRRWEDGRVLSAENMADRCAKLYGERSYVTHRADLLQTLRNAIPDHMIRLSSRLIDVEERGDALRLRFQDGSFEKADIVVGADGIHSTIRGLIATPTPAEYSGLCAFRALVPAQEAPMFTRRPVQTLWIGPGRHLVHYPVSAGSMINIIAVAPAAGMFDEDWNATSTVDEFLAEFDGWDPRLIDLISSVRNPGRWALLDRAPLDRWTTKRMTLLGDAAHPMFPFLAQGSAQAIEDAAALAHCLVGNLSDPEQALFHYENIRRPRTTRIQELSRSRKDTNHLPDGHDQQLRDLRLETADPLLQNAWLYGYDAELDENLVVR